MEKQVRWHLEDIIRDPKIDPLDVVKIKREIDASNQERVNQVEKIDDWFIDFFKDTSANTDAKLNSESPAWVIDRLSILSFKKFHMQEQVDRTDVDEEHIQNCQNKLAIELRAPKFFWMKVTDLVQIISTFEQLNYKGLTQITTSSDA